MSPIGRELRWLGARWRSLLPVTALAAGLLALLVLGSTSGTVSIGDRTELGAIYAAAPATILVPVAAAFGTLLSVSADRGWLTLELCWQPDRRRLLTTKNLALAGTAFGAALLIAVAMAGVSTATSAGAGIPFFDILPITLGAAAGFTAWALLSAAIATALNSRVQALLIVLAYWAIVHPMLKNINASAAAVLPAEATMPFVAAANTPHGLIPSALALTAAIALAWAGAYAAFTRRDV